MYVMEILRYEVPEDLVGDEGQMVSILRMVVPHTHDVVIDRDPSRLPHILVESNTREMHNLLSTIAVGRFGLKRVRRPAQ